MATIDYPTPCPCCRQTFDNPGARQRHINTCIESDWDEYDVHLGMSIEECIQTAEEVVKTAVEAFDDVALVWNGDKDTTALVHIIDESVGLDAVDVCVIDHGQHFAETEQYVAEQADAMGFEFDLVANESMLDHCVTDPPYLDGGDPITWVPMRLLDEESQSEVERLIDADAPDDEYRETEDGIEVPFYAGGVIGASLLQGIPLRRLGEEYNAVMTGLRKWETPAENRADSESAFREQYFSRRESPEHHRVHPMLDWRDNFGFAYLQHPEHNYPVHPLYEQGYMEIGPKPVVSPGGGGGQSPTGDADVDQGVMAHLRDLGYM